MLGGLNETKPGLVGAVSVSRITSEQPAKGRQESGEEGRRTWGSWWVVRELWRALGSRKAVSGPCSVSQTDGSDAGQLSGLAFFGGCVPALRQKWPW